MLGSVFKADEDLYGHIWICRAIYISRCSASSITQYSGHHWTATALFNFRWWWHGILPELASHYGRLDPRSNMIGKWIQVRLTPVGHKSVISGHPRREILQASPWHGCQNCIDPFLRFALPWNALIQTGPTQSLGGSYTPAHFQWLHTASSGCPGHGMLCKLVRPAGQFM